MMSENGGGTVAKKSKGEIQDLLKREVEILKDFKPYVVIVNKPKTKGLKSENGPDVNTGDLGNPVVLETDCGWVMNYYIADGKSPAYAEVGRGLNEEAFAGRMLLEEQTFMTAAEVVDFLISQGWKGFELQEGTSAMSWAIWAYLKYKKMKLGGYKAPEGSDVKFKNCWHVLESRKDYDATLQLAPTTGTMVQAADGITDDEDSSDIE
jgi:hypothetical protein